VAIVWSSPYCSCAAVLRRVDDEPVGVGSDMATSGDAAVASLSVRGVGHSGARRRFESDMGGLLRREEGEGSCGGVEGVGVDEEEVGVDI
jgi:hypothetical protein